MTTTTTPRYGLWVDGPSWRGEITGGADHPDDLRDPGGHRGIAREVVIDTGTGWRSLTPQERRDIGEDYR